MRARLTAWMLLTIIAAGAAWAGTVEVRPLAVDERPGRHVLRGDAATLSIDRAAFESAIFWDARPWLGRVDRVDASDDDALDLLPADGRPLVAGGRALDRRSGRSVTAVAEGIVLLPVGPREALLVRRDSGAVLSYRFLAADGRELARLDGPRPSPGEPFVPASVELLAHDARANDGMTIGYEPLRAALEPGATAFVQRSISADTALSALDPGWTSIADVVAPDLTSVVTGPDADDPATQVTLPEVWDFTTLDMSRLDWRTFYTVRDDTAWSGCLESCSPRDVGPTPPDDSWQSYLKIDRYDDVGGLQTRDMFLLNLNDTGANPAIAVPFVAKNELDNPVGGRLQVCFTDSTDGTESLRFFQFLGADPASALLGVGDAWTTGNWTSCNDASGLRLTLSSACDNQCYPSCSGPSPRARGRLGGGAGFGTEIVEDGWIALPTGNYLPALLMRQETNLEAGANFFGTCNISNTPSRSFDYFWINEDYGFLGLLSSPDSETIAPDDWSANGNVADGLDVTWGPFPPPQLRAEACLGATRVSWALPADGSNLDDEPGISDNGYVVAWGNLPDADALVDFSSNPNHTPLPGEAGYLAAPAGLEPTSYTIAGWPGATLDATVVSGMRYTDPDANDAIPYTSPAQYRVVADPAQLDPGAFRVGTAVAPFVTKAGADLQLDWPGVAGAAGYAIEVFDLASRAAIPCPGGLDCNPPLAGAVHAGAATSTAGFGYRVVAVDPCGTASAD